MVVLAAAAVASGWSSYLGTVFGTGPAAFQVSGYTVDWGAMLIVGVLTVLLTFGAKVSSRVSAVITARARLGQGPRHPTSTTRTFNRLVFRPNKSTMRFHQTIYLTSCTAASGSIPFVLAPAAVGVAIGQLLARVGQRERP